MLSIIVAYSKNKVIGKDGKMPWNIPDDLAHFKEMTLGNIVIMGRKTFESIGNVLPDRTNIILSGNKHYKVDGAISTNSFEAAVAIAKKLAKQQDVEKEIFIAGGSAIYKRSIDLADNIYVTLVKKYYDGDVFFPDFDENKFDRKVTGSGNSPVEYEFITYTRKQNKLTQSK